MYKIIADSVVISTVVVRVNACFFNWKDLITVAYVVDCLCVVLVVR